MLPFWKINRLLANWVGSINHPEGTICPCAKAQQESHSTACRRAESREDLAHRARVGRGAWSQTQGVRLGWQRAQQRLKTWRCTEEQLELASVACWSGVGS